MSSKPHKIHTTLVRSTLISLRMKMVLAAVLCMAAALIFATVPGEAATPSSGTLTPTSGTLTYTAGPFFTPNVTSNIPGNTQPDCTEETPCDDYALTVDATGATQAFLDTHLIEVTISWPSAAADFDLYVLKGAAVIKDAATAANPEIAVFEPEAGVNSYTRTGFDPDGSLLIDLFGEGEKENKAFLYEGGQGGEHSRWLLAQA